MFFPFFLGGGGYIFFGPKYKPMEKFEDTPVKIYYNKKKIWELKH
jgi:hypothetical protein